MCRVPRRLHQCRRGGREQRSLVDVEVDDLADAIVMVAAGHIPNSPRHWDVLTKEWGELLA